MRHDPVAKRRPTNVSLSETNVALAKELAINISLACDTGLALAVKRERERRWREEHREAIERCNRWVEENGIPLSDLRDPLLDLPDS